MSGNDAALCLRCVQVCQLTLALSLHMYISRANKFLSLLNECHNLIVKLDASYNVHVGVVFLFFLFYVCTSSVAASVHSFIHRLYATFSKLFQWRGHSCELNAGIIHRYIISILWKYPSKQDEAVSSSLSFNHVVMYFAEEIPAYRKCMKMIQILWGFMIFALLSENRICITDLVMWERALTLGIPLN